VAASGFAGLTCGHCAITFFFNQNQDWVRKNMTSTGGGILGMGKSEIGWIYCWSWLDAPTDTKRGVGCWVNARCCLGLRNIVMASHMHQRISYSYTHNRSHLCSNRLSHY
jgi:hypothetical protein